MDLAPRRLTLALSLTALLALSAGGLVGCQKKVSRDNASKISEGMTLAAVTKILGSGEKEEGATGTDISSAGIMDSKANASTDEVYVWKDGAAQIAITFRGGKVVTVSTQNLP